MRSFDFAPYRRSTVGFDRLFDYLERSSRTEPSENYPPYDIERLGDDRYRITLAVAGFGVGDIDIVANQNLLTITGRRGESRHKEGQFLHAGIATRAFERRFELADFVRVDAAELKDGLLSIELVREIPETMKPRKIDIRSGQTIQGSAERQREPAVQQPQADRTPKDETENRREPAHSGA